MAHPEGLEPPCIQLAFSRVEIWRHTGALLFKRLPQNYIRYILGCQLEFLERMAGISPVLSGLEGQGTYPIPHPHYKNIPIFCFNVK